MASEAEAATVARGPLAARPSGCDGGAPASSGAAAPSPRRSRRRRAAGTPRSASFGVGFEELVAKLDVVVDIVVDLSTALAPLVSSWGAAPATRPTEAVTAKFPFFGFGNGDDSANDADAVPPYSQFSNPVDAVYEKGSDTIVARKEKQLDESFQRLEEIPRLLEAKAGKKGHPGPAAPLHAREHGVPLGSEGHGGVREGMSRARHPSSEAGDGLSDPYSASGRRLALLADQQSRGRRLRLESFKRLEKFPKLLESKAGEEGHLGPAAPLHAREHGVPLGMSRARHSSSEAGDGLSDPYSASGRRLALLADQQSRGRRLRLESFKRLEKFPKLLEANSAEVFTPVQ